MSKKNNDALVLITNPSYAPINYDHAEQKKRVEKRWVEIANEVGYTPDYAEFALQYLLSSVGAYPDLDDCDSFNLKILADILDGSEPEVYQREGQSFMRLKAKPKKSKGGFQKGK